MIIIEDSDLKSPHQVQVRIAQQREVDAAKESQNGHLGSVRHPQSHPTPARSSFSPSYHTTPLLPPPPPPSYPNIPSQWTHPPPAKRFWKAFALALLIYIALLALARSIIHMASRGIWDDASVGGPRVEDGTVLESIRGRSWTSYQPRPGWAPTFPQSAGTSFTLPVASETLYLISRGSYQSGKVELKQGNDPGGDVRVDVRVAYHDERALARATVCRLSKAGNKHGVGIFTPTPAWPDMRDRLYFEIVVTFPAAPSERAPLRINEFTTHTDNFAHEIGHLWQSLLFDNMDLRTVNGAIQAGSITLTRGSLTSSNGAIVGHFNTSDSLILRTSNARIQATASLFNTGEETTQLEMRTSNGPITSSVSLATASGSGGHFILTSHSSNAGIKLQYDDAPPGSHLLSDVRTSNGAAMVTMHPTFEGTYEVSTSNSRPVVRDTRPEDPLGRGRRRVVEERTAGGTISGRVYWARGDGRRRVEGASTVYTSNAQASLDL